MFDGRSRGNAGIAWHDKLEPLCKNLKFVRIVLESVALTHQEMKAGTMAAMEREELRANTSTLLDGAISVLGEQEYFDGLKTAFSKFK